MAESEQQFIGGEGGGVILGEGGEAIAEEFTPTPNPVAPQDKFPVTEVPCNRPFDGNSANKVCHPSNETVALGDDLSYLQVGGGLNGQGAIFFDVDHQLSENNLNPPDSTFDALGPLLKISRARYGGLAITRTYLAHSFSRTYSVIGPQP